MSQMNKHQQNTQYNNSREGRNFQGNLGGALNGAAAGNISRNYGQKHPHEMQANTTGTKKGAIVNTQNVLQNKATLP